MNKSPSVYLDACCFCRLLDDPSQYRVRLETEAVVTILECCDRGEMSLISSDALEFELQKIPSVEGREQIFAFLGAAKTFVETNENIEHRAENFCKLGFTLYDALHLAFAEASEATVFLTTDDRLLRKAISYADDIKVKVFNPVTWLMENQELI
ncbi:type II toxin-antitoxin system VapC family toxin [Pseudanabaena mucicola]|uniref:PIN domain-containing protein n=1 Tax=Pseudanabaena mucicola FACHB-723 TaxID=2692860 RepID=A0ABR8A133_9CYAN|nr:PIN domain-containing protein [Pseudanabaena mucicola]MBD2189829.1 PIN domain-containing protein [Pseudanabaena mucicola FACHB-723]